MAKEIKADFFKKLIDKYGAIKKIGNSKSLFETQSSNVRIYVRYSKLHKRDQMFYGLREEDLQQLEGHPSVICFLWDNQVDPLILPFLDYEEIFQSTTPANDGQYKVQIFLQEDGTEFYIARVGRFNVESYFGWSVLENLVDRNNIKAIPELSHSQIQSLLGFIGNNKGYEIWVPMNDRGRLDWSLVNKFECVNLMRFEFEKAKEILQEVDVIWIQRGSNKVAALFEIEHSTPIYSGLLRFNDFHLTLPNIRPRFSIVANDTRRSLFIKQLNRPTFVASGLNEKCTFLEYMNVFGWYNRIIKTF